MSPSPPRQAVKSAREAGNALDVGGLLALGTLDDVKLDILSFAQRAVALSDDRRVVNKYVLSLFTRDEAVPFASLNHFTLPLAICCSCYFLDYFLWFGL